MLLLVCGDRDSAVRVQHHLAAAEYGHQQEETEQEEEEEGKTKVHIYIEPAWGGGLRDHVDKYTHKKPAYSSDVVLFYTLREVPQGLELFQNTVHL